MNLKFQDVNNHDGSRTRTFTDLKSSLLFAARMQNLGFKTTFAANHLDIFNEWWYPVRYWREVPQESTFQDQANDAYADLRRAGWY
jgi:hypothetical protein